jgi:hypothetical protein
MKFTSVVVKTTGARVVFAVHDSRKGAELAAARLRAFSSEARAEVVAGVAGQPGQMLRERAEAGGER